MNGLVGCGCGGAVVIERLGLGEDLGALEGLRAFHILQVDGDFDLQHIDTVAVLGELSHGVGDDFGLQGGELGAFVFQAFLVANQLEEERDVVGAALVADALGPGLLVVVDLGIVKGRVVEQDLDAIGAGFLEATDGPDVEQIGQACRMTFAS